MTWESVDFPEPLGPMIACTSPLFTVSDSPWRISRSSTRTCRFFTSSRDIIVFRLSSLRLGSAEGRGSKGEWYVSIHPSRRLLTRPPQDEALTDRPLQRDRDQLLRFHREF